MDRRSFVVALVGLAACDRAASPPGAQRAAPLDASRAVATPRALDASAIRQRGLTDSELVLLRSIFQDAVAYATVRVIDDHFGPFQPDNVYMTPEGSIYAPGALWRDDYAAPSVDPYTQAVFVHEIGHVWQFQNGMDMIAEGVVALASGRGDYEKAYAYTLRRDGDLLDYGMEQQASILEDWFLLGVHGLDPSRMENPRAEVTLYADVLARFTANPAYARGVSAEEQFERHVAGVRGEPPGAPGCGIPADEQKSPHLCNWRFDDR